MTLFAIFISRLDIEEEEEVKWPQMVKIEGDDPQIKRKEGGNSVVMVIQYDETQGNVKGVYDGTEKPDGTLRDLSKPTDEDKEKKES